MTSTRLSRAGPGRRKGGARRAASGETDRGRLYVEVTQRIIAELEAGTVPWVTPWSAPDGSAAAAVGLPRNALTGRPYSGINILTLWGELFARGYASQCWLTFRQAIQAGGCVRKGERGVGIVYADRFIPAAERERARDSGDEPKHVPFLRRSTLFNIAQCDGLRPGLAPEPVPLPEREIVPVAEAVIAASGVRVVVQGAQAYYAPGPDHVVVPPQPAFFEQVNYYRTVLHELTHATGHAKRLGRDLGHAFGSKGYAREELVAEMGSAFLCAALGIVPTVRHSDYIASWLEVLRADLSDDPAVRSMAGPRGRAIFRAASLASKAADWLLARHREANADAIAGRIAA
ncbi:ssDNA-binding domain-containing protein [Sphingomonas cannabina]|uniref:ArdC family protein n=1 Tax=Sphingomonas cannabina TaxID=2899123 RepID=UPI001EECB01A|nr:zincin-like metallopeptidase domain-containing protein [Sphingomonas cannabina]UIJ44783.1 ssDNA-binding domain-containing protein [Sphingomonas cannabina]